MDVRAKIKNTVADIIQRPKYVVLGLIILFVVNCLSFAVLIGNSPDAERLLIITFLLIPVWPVAIVIYGIAQLGRRASDDERELRRKREKILRYFSIATAILLLILIVYWRYYVETYFLPIPTITQVVLILIVSSLFVIIIWHWTKYSDNKLSSYVNTAPHHYLVAAIVFVVTLISYITLGDVDIPPRELMDLSSSTREILRTTKLTFQMATWIGVFTSLGALVLGYLRPTGSTTESNDQQNNNKPNKVTFSFGPSVDNKHEDVTVSAPQSDNLEVLLSTLNLNNSKLDKLLKQPALSSQPLISSDVVADRIGMIRGRLTGEIKELTKRGNLNLTIGILTTLGAASALYWGLIATQPQPDQTGTAGLLRHYLPRISFAVFIEVFSFFFLKLYKSSLEDIKYYHNELTNLDSRLLALEIAAAAQLSDALTSILLGLLNTDRNFILKSGESTVELEKIKTEQQHMRTLINVMSAKLPDLGSSSKDSNKG